MMQFPRDAVSQSWRIIPRTAENSVWPASVLVSARPEPTGLCLAYFLPEPFCFWSAFANAAAQMAAILALATLDVFESHEINVATGRALSFQLRRMRSRSHNVSCYSLWRNFAI